MQTRSIILNLHLQYRLWIAELNYLVDEIRILKDYLLELATYKENTITSDLNTTLTEIRENIDHIRNEMHLDKMTLASLLKSNTSHQSWDDNRTELLKNQYETIKSRLQQLRKEI